MTYFSPTRVGAHDKVALCYAAFVTLPTFKKHIEDLRAFERFEKREIDELVNQNRRGGGDLLSSQIFVQEYQSGSGTYSLNTFHGLFYAEISEIKAWSCDAYPIAYFIGFRVEAIRGAEIMVSREKGTLNVLSLKPLTKSANTKIEVRLNKTGARLCRDLTRRGCVDGILYRYH